MIGNPGSTTNRFCYPSQSYLLRIARPSVVRRGRLAPQPFFRFRVAGLASCNFSAQRSGHRSINALRRQGKQTMERYVGTSWGQRRQSGGWDGIWTGLLRHILRSVGPAKNQTRWHSAGGKKKWVLTVPPVFCLLPVWSFWGIVRMHASVARGMQQLRWDGIIVVVRRFDSLCAGGRPVIFYS